MFIEVADPTTVRLEEVYCPNCHLSTRADKEYCLHCGKLIVSTPKKKEEVIH